MLTLCLFLVLVAFVISLVGTGVVRTLSRRLNAHDTPPIPGQVKEAPRRVPNTGGVAIFWAIAIPIAAGLLYVATLDPASTAEWRIGKTLIPEAARVHVLGIQQQAPLAYLLLGCLLILHILGLIDDRRPLGPWFKLAVMAIPAFTIPIVTTYIPQFAQTRLLTLLDAHAGGPWLSIIITALWFLVVTNAMNFMDNMDGLSAGVAAVAGCIFLTGALLNQQWFIAACLALLVGACGGFLFYNAPVGRGASIFMGDGGSLVLGFLLAFLTTRTTYIDPSSNHNRWYAVLMPLIVLAVPLYDFTSVTIIRLRQGRSPFIGDLQHLSHRLVRRGLTKSAAVLIICGVTAITGLGGVYLRDLPPPAALLVGIQTAFMLVVIATFEYASAKP